MSKEHVRWTRPAGQSGIQRKRVRRERGEREGEREGDRDRERERERQRQTDREKIEVLIG